MRNEKSKNFFRVGAEDFKIIPGGPITYWINSEMRRIFTFPTIDKVSSPRRTLR